MLNSLTTAVKNGRWTRFFQYSDEHRTDWVGPICMVLLCIAGVFFIYSAQSYSGGSSWKMQIVWVIVGLGVYTVLSFLNYKVFLEYAHVVYWVGILLLIPLALQSILLDLHRSIGGFPKVSIPLVQTRFGATRWLDFGFFSVQPSELAKIGTLVMVASLLARSELKSFRDSIKVLIKTGFAFLLPLFLIFLQPDLGSSLVFPPMVFSLLYVSRLSQRFFAVALVAFIATVVVVGWDVYRYKAFMESHGYSFTHDTGNYEKTSWIPLKDYQRNRILTFAAPQIVDPRGTGVAWNLNQSLIAVAGGGALGKGLGEGTQAKLGYLPPTVAPNDFIYSVIAEESGFLGGSLVIVLFLILVCNGIRIAGLSRDRFGMLLAVGVSVVFTVHVFINVGMTIGLMPITGLPLPFLSYGGSFVLSCCILQGLVQSVYRFRKDFS